MIKNNISRSDDVKLLQFLLTRLAMHYNEGEGTDYLIKLKDLIDRTKVYSHRDRFVLVSENDMGGERWMESRGPVSHETYVGESNGIKVIERAKHMGDQYGRQMICRLEPIGDLAEFERLMDKEL